MYFNSVAQGTCIYRSRKVGAGTENEQKKTNRKDDRKKSKITGMHI